MTDGSWHARFDEKIREVDPPDRLPDRGPCWIFGGYVLPNGYVHFWHSGEKRYAHRVAHERWIGPIPEGLHVDHQCRVRTCVNPAHLEAVTQRENTLRSGSMAAIRARQTHCIHGHEFDVANTYLAANGTRKCRTCRTEAKRRERAKAV